MPTYDLPDKTESKETKKIWLLDKCKSFVNKFVFDAEDIDCLIQQTHELQLASLGKYKCRAKECDKVYIYHSARVRYLLNYFNLFTVLNVIITVITWMHSTCNHTNI